jgi:hypothetical protein
MIGVGSLVGASAGALAGGIEARLLRRSALAPSPLAMVLRLALVGGVLLGAALLGVLPAAAAGWFVGLVVSVGWLTWRWR